MRGSPLALVVVVAAARAAAAVPVDVPAGWVEQPKSVADSGLDRIRAVPGTRSIDATVYFSPDSDAQLTVMTWTWKRERAATRSEVTQVDEGIESGSRKQAPEHVSTARRFDGDQLVVDEIDGRAGVRVHQVRRHGIDADGVTHTLVVTCVGAAAAIAGCEAAQRGVRLVVPEQVAFADAGADDKHDASYIAGEITGAALTIAVILYFVFRRKKSS
jgi:hypothetical protein